MSPLPSSLWSLRVTRHRRQRHCFCFSNTIHIVSLASCIWFSFSERPNDSFEVCQKIGFLWCVCDVTAKCLGLDHQMEEKIIFRYNCLNSKLRNKQFDFKSFLFFSVNSIQLLPLKGGNLLKKNFLVKRICMATHVTI